MRRIGIVFRLCLLGAIAGIVFATLYFVGHPGNSPGPQIVVFLLLGTVPVGIYFWTVRATLFQDAAAVTDSSIDLTYYLGFLITLVTLLVTVISYNVVYLNAKNAAASAVFVGISFGLSLIATACALYARVELTQLRDRLFAKQDAEDTLRERIYELDEAYRHLSSVMNEATSRFADGLSGANEVLTRQVGEVVEGARSRLSAFVESSSLEVSGQSEELFRRMGAVIDDARTGLADFIKAAALESSSSALANAVAEITASLVKTGQELNDLFRSLDGVERRAAAAMKHVDALGTSAERAWKSASEVGESLGRVSSHAASLDVEPLRAGLANLQRTVEALDATATKAERTYVAASGAATESLRARTEELTAAAHAISNAFLALNTELERTAAAVIEAAR